MKEMKLSGVNLVLVDHRSQVRNGLRMALNDVGLHNNNISDGTEYAAVNNAMHSKILPDILICDTDLGDGDMSKMFNAIRHNEVGQNPFLAIIAFSWDPTERLVDDMLNAGVDYLLAAPFSPKQILDRIKLLIHNRSSFVVTSDYVGPDRREAAGRRPSSVAPIEIPNSLRAKAFGDYNEGKMRRAIQSTIEVVNEQKMERHAARLAKNAGVVANSCARDPAEMDRTAVATLLDSANDLRWRAHNNGQCHLADLCDAVVHVIEGIQSDHKRTRAKDLQILKQLSLAIQASVETGGHRASVAHQIADTVVSRLH